MGDSEFACASCPLVRKNRNGQLSAQVAAWSQFGTLLLLGWGYFYTVQPIYQRDRLQEDLSRLEIEVKGLRDEASSAIASKVEAERRVEAVNQVLERASRDVENLSDQRWELDRQIALKNEELLGLSSRLQSAVEQRESAVARSEEANAQLVRNYVLLGLAFEPAEFSIPRDKAFERDQLNANHLRNSWVDYTERVPAFLRRLSAGWNSQLGVEKDMFGQMLVEIEQRFIENRTSCRLPDFEAWGRSAETALSAIDERHKAECGDRGERAFRIWMDLAGISPRELPEFKEKSWFAELESKVRACPDLSSSTVQAQITMRFDEASATCSTFALSQLVNAAQLGSRPLVVDWRTLDAPDPEKILIAATSSEAGARIQSESSD